jgi:drug/metabolite transporter (DMT)-like permease
MVYNVGNSHRAVARVRFAGLLLGALAALLWATAGPFFRIAGSYGLDIVVINLVRFSLSSLVLLGALFTRQRHRKEPKWNVMHPLFLLGSAGMVVSSLFLTLAFLRIPIGTSMVLYHTAPFWVMLGTWCFSRKTPTAFQIVAFVLAMVGVWKTVGGVRLAASLDLPGVASALFASFGYAFYVLNGHFGPGRLDGFGLYSRTFFVATIMVWIIAAVGGKIDDLLRIPVKAWFVLFYLAFVTALIPYGLLLAALRYISGSAASITTMSEVPFSMMWAFIILGERPETGVLIGGALVLLGVGIMTFDKGERTR